MIAFSRPYKVDVFQITKEVRADNSTWPEWLYQAWQLDPTERGAVFPENYPNSDGTDRLVVRISESRATIVGWGDYIMNIGGRLTTIDYASFQEEFVPPGQLSDGYHTFDELYEHRYALFVALANILFIRDLADVYIAEANADGTKEPGWFLVVVNSPEGQISYHLPDRLRKEMSVDMPVYDVNPEYDGHTSQDVIERLMKLDL